MSAGPIALVGSGEYLPIMQDIEANLIAGRYIYDIEANVATTVVRIVEGIVTVNPGVTR